MAERLAAMLGAPALLSRFSRLLIDPNRGLDDPTLIMQISDGLIVPGNVGLDETEIAARIERYYEPYHCAIDRAVEAGLAAGKPPVIVSVHSFTQAWKGVPRPWSVGRACGTRTRGLRCRCSTALRDHPRHRGRRQRPYSGQLKGDTLYRHGTVRGLAHALIEVRQDLILSERGSGRMGGASRRGAAQGDAPGKRSARDRAARLSYRQRHAEAPASKPCKGASLMDEKTRTELEAAAFRRLVAHLRERSDVENIDLMELAGFCRNCLSGWYQEAAAAKGIALSKEEAREIVYGMALRGVEG